MMLKRLPKVKKRQTRRSITTKRGTLANARHIFGILTPKKKGSHLKVDRIMLNWFASIRTLRHMRQASVSLDKMRQEINRVTDRAGTRREIVSRATIANWDHPHNDRRLRDRVWSKATLKYKVPDDIDLLLIYSTVLESECMNWSSAWESQGFAALEITEHKTRIRVRPVMQCTYKQKGSPCGEFVVVKKIGRVLCKRHRRHK